VFDDIAALFHENVVDAFTSYLESRRTGTAGRSRDLRAAIAAATALYHFREHQPSTFSKSRADIGRQCPDYSLLGDVVNASKHKDLTRGNPQIDSAEQIEERLIITEYQDEQGVYRHIEKQVILKLTSGTERDLLDVMISVMNFWQVELAALGLIPARPSYVSPRDPQPRSRAECNDGRLDFELVQGVRFKQTYCLQKYNYDTGQVEPVDLTGSNLEFRIYKPRYNVDVTLRDDRTGQELIRTISLSEEESQTLMSQQSDQDKQRYLANLPQAQAAIRQLEAEARCVEACSGPQPRETSKPA
jgi:hypothetical protein